MKETFVDKRINEWSEDRGRLDGYTLQEYFDYYMWQNQFQVWDDQYTVGFIANRWMDSRSTCSSVAVPMRMPWLIDCKNRYGLIDCKDDTHN